MFHKNTASQMFCPASRVESSSSSGDSHALMIVLLQPEGAADIKHLPFSASLRGSTRGDWTSVSSLAEASPPLRESLSSGERSLPRGTDDTRFNDDACAGADGGLSSSSWGSEVGCRSPPAAFLLLARFSS